MDITYLGNHRYTSQLLANQTLHDPLEGLLHLDDIIFVKCQTLLSTRTNKKKSVTLSVTLNFNMSREIILPNFHLHMEPTGVLQDQNVCINSGGMNIQLIKERK